jgi:RHS repeat-associated protein
MALYFTVFNQGFIMAWLSSLAGRLCIQAIVSIVLLSFSAVFNADVHAQPARDAVSDRVGATAGQFRVDESGAATYSIPIYTPPGTAGVVPQLGFSYSSQGGTGPLGKGWGISGASGISRCRATREHGDFFANGAAVDGDPAPINFSDSDRYCLDGQRLIPAPATAQVCKALSGATVSQYRTELDSFQRICAYRFVLADGPRFFTVERKDGSTSWYGDRVSTAGNATGTRADSVMPVTATPSVFLSWSQTRFQDSTGNYIDYEYLKNPAGASYPGEQVLYQVRYTGKVVLPGQSGAAKSPYATVRFNYSTMPAADISSGYVSGMLTFQTQKLDSVSVINGSTTVRHYVMAYAKSISGTNVNTLTSFKECSDASQSTCYSPTNFDWSVARNQLLSYDWPTDLYIGNNDKFEGYQLADIDGDGRQDMVWLIDGNSTVAGQCLSEYVMVAFGAIDSAGRNTFTRPDQGNVCTTSELIPGLGQGSWLLFDYNGDGRDDLMMPSDTTNQWLIYPSVGRPATPTTKVFDTSQNLIAGLTPAIPKTIKDKHPQLVDFNGDGLLDVVYERNLTHYARLMTRTGGSFAWAAEKNVVMTGAMPSKCSTASVCTISMSSDKSSLGAFQLLDFNGDSRSDMVLNYSGLTTNPSAVFNTLVSLNVTSITASTVNLQQGFAWDGPSTAYRFADYNGDGLTDVIAGAVETWKLWKNTGQGFISHAQTITASYSNYLQIVDVNGDGRADIVYPKTNTTTFDVRYGLAAGGFSAASAFPGGTQLINCTTACMDRFSYIFSDFDADGGLDMFRVKWGTDTGGSPGQRLYSARSDNVSRFQPRDVMMRITNGFGAKTELVYKPLSLKSVYLRDSNSRNSLNWGRGSPVQDLLAPMYVVAMARSSAPTYADANAMSSVYYRYAGAKMQAGGRGYLGFREITTYDVNYPGKYIATTTQYAQNFPFIGNPVATSRRVVSGTYTPDACYTTVTEACYSTLGATHPAIGGTLVGNSVQSWETSVAYNPNQQDVLYVRTQGTQDEQFDLNTGVRNSRVNTVMSYTTFGNVYQTAVDTFTGTSNTNPVTITTSNTYVNDETNWRLGRMTASAVVHTRDGVSITRTTAYDYDMAGPVTGFMKAERIQPNGNVREDLRTEYQLDEYGNRIGSYTCSQNVAPCIQTTGLALNPWLSYEQVQRYSRVTYDADGRYPVTTHEPFRAVGATWDSGQITEYVTQTVLARDEFGEPTRVQDVNGRVAASMNGAMGRDYWSWAPTASSQAVGSLGYGVHSTKTYRFCGTGTDKVSCPTGAVFREQVKADGAATKWTYFDVLGRPMAAVAESFNVNVTGKDFAATCQWYDSTGKTYASSNPFFLTDAALNAAPQFASNPCVLANRQLNKTVYDILGRPTQITLADNSVTSVAYNGLSTTTTNAKNQTKTEIKNASGELVQAIDQNSFSTFYYYNAAGNLTAVARDSGRGMIATYMSYDNLGRKVSMNDPDAGIRGYGYTPAGELEVEVDNQGRHIHKRYDRRGRLVWEGAVDYTPEPDRWERNTLYHYDQAAYGVGQVQSSATWGTQGHWNGTAGLETQQSNAAAYDDMGRVTNTTTQIDGVSYNSAVVYDGLGRGYKTQDPSGKWTKTEFNTRGHTVRICATDENDIAPGCLPGHANTYLENMDSDARGNITWDRKGGVAEMITNRIYDPVTGRLASICEGSNGCQIMGESYGWDAVGNLTAHDKGGYLETFEYDGMNRLTHGRLMRVGATNYDIYTSPFTVLNNYDYLGNICSKLIDGVVQNYTYANRAGCGLNTSSGYVNSDTTSSPHQVQGANGYTYAYDSHGNQTVATHGDGTKTRTVHYNLDERAYEMTKGTDITRFWYGIGGDRYKRQDTSVAGVKTTINVGNLEIETLGNLTTTKRTVAGVYLEVSYKYAPPSKLGRPTESKYLHHDQLGNVVRITDANGVVLEKLDFDAWGARRNVNDPRQTFITAGQVSNGTLTLPSNQILRLYATKRGFTGHEMVDGFDIVHMNGRIYDNTLGRFLQADPVVQDPSNTQNFNRYTYVWNNPLAYTDPSGMFSVRNFLNIAAQLVGFVAMLVPGLQWVGWVAYGLNVASALASGGLKAGLLTAFTSLIKLPGGTFARAAQSVLIAGVSSVIMGGKFGAGLIGGLKSAAIGFVMQNVAAGVKSAQTGGKMATVSRESSGKRQDPSDSNVKKQGMVGVPEGTVKDVLSAQERADLATKYIDKVSIVLNKRGPFKTPEIAARAFRNLFAPMSGYLGLEFGANIEPVDGGFVLDGIVRSTSFMGSPSNFGWNAPVSYSQSAVAYAHTHPELNFVGKGFSYDDIAYADGYAKLEHAYVFYPEGFGRRLDMNAARASGWSLEQVYAYGQDKYAPSFK